MRARAASSIYRNRPVSTSCRRLRQKPGSGFLSCSRWMCCTATGRFFPSRWLKPRPWTQVCGKRRHGRRLAKPRRPGSRLPSRRCWTWRATRAGGGSRKAQAKTPGLHRGSRRPRSGAFRKRRPASPPPWARLPSISPLMARSRPDVNTHPRTCPARPCTRCISRHSPRLSMPGLRRSCRRSAIWPACR